MESTGYVIWFAEMLSEPGHQLVIGDAVRIRAQVVRKQKTDQNDALHLLELLLRGDFPRIWIPSVEDRDTRVLLQHRHHYLAQMRTRVKNGLQALATTYSVRRRWKLWTLRGQCESRHSPLRAGMARGFSDQSMIEKLLELPASAARGVSESVMMARRGRIDGWRN